MKTIHRIFALCALFAFVGCASKKSVAVVDDSGAPVPGARVVVQAMSMEGAPTFTAGDGTAEVDTITGARWLAITKQGYERAQVDMPTNWPLKVVLKKETQKP